MRILRSLKLGVICCGIFLSSGCGSSGSNVTGTLTVSTPTITSSASYSQVAFTITYTNPNVTDVGNVNVSVVTRFPSGNTSTVYKLNSNGTNSSSFTLTYTLPRGQNDQSFKLIAVTGNLTSSVIAIIPAAALPAPVPMAALPSTLTFDATATNGDTQYSIISGGVGGYSVLNVNPSPNPNIFANMSGSTRLRIKKLSSITGGSATILVGDSASPPNNVTITVNY